MTSDGDDQRTSSRHDDEERQVLTMFLDSQRESIERKLDGLSRQQAVERHVSSKTTLLGLVKHLIDVEHWWFRSVFDGETGLAYSWEHGGVPDSEFDIDASDEVEPLLLRYRQACRQSREITARSLLSDGCVHPDKNHNLRWILTHMIEETARHAGHADILRELTDEQVDE